jgi:cobalt-zinc-cadmium efflux system membrane fusion protein
MDCRLWLSLVFAWALAIAGCGKANRNDNRAAPSTTPQAPSNVVIIPPDSPKLAQIRVEPMKVVAIPAGEVTAPGKVEANPNRISRVPLPAPGKVARVLVKLGDSVAVGQPLLTLESPEADAAMAAFLQSVAGVTQANAALTQAYASLSKANSSQRKAQADYHRIADLFEHNAVPQKEVLNAENDLKQATAEVETANAAVEQSKALIEQAKAVREQAQRRIAVLGLKPGDAKPRIVVRAPLAGKVLELSIVAGEYRNDTATPVLTVADLRTVWVTSDVPENAIRLISVGESVDITLDAYPDQTFGGRVARIADTLDSKTRTMKRRDAAQELAVMVRYLLRFALQQRLLFVALGLALVGIGVYVFTNLRIEAYPDISDTQAVVIPLYPGHAAEEVEQQATVPIGGNSMRRSNCPKATR